MLISNKDAVTESGKTTDYTRPMDKINGTALVPISIDGGSKFSRTALTKQWRIIADRHQHMSVVLADDLMVYNRLDGHTDPDDLNRKLQQYQRNFFPLVGRVFDTLKVATSHWSARTFSAYSTPHFASVLRRLTVLAEIDQAFRLALEERIQFLLTGKDDNTDNRRTGALEYWRIRSYLIDETAWALSTMTEFGIHDHYYPDDPADLMRCLILRSDTQKVLSSLNIAPNRLRFWNFHSKVRSTGDWAIAWEWEA